MSVSCSVAVCGMFCFRTTYHFSLRGGGGNHQIVSSFQKTSPTYYISLYNFGCHHSNLMGSPFSLFASLLPSVFACIPAFPGAAQDKRYSLLMCQTVSPVRLNSSQDGHCDFAQHRAWCPKRASGSSTERGSKRSQKAHLFLKAEPFQTCCIFLPYTSSSFA